MSFRVCICIFGCYKGQEWGGGGIIYLLGNFYDLDNLMNITYDYEIK